MQHERRKNIVAKIQKDQTLKISDLTREFQVSIETIRRDLEFLESQGQLRRVYGGAVLSGGGGYSVIEAGYAQRELTNRPQKKAIGEAAASLVGDGDSLFIDMGTTTGEFARRLSGKRNLTILTNSGIIARELAQNTGGSCSIILLGGLVRKDEFTLSGAMTDANLRNFYVAKAVISIGGISIQTGITDYNLGEASTRRAAVERAGEVIGLADYSKFSITALNYICPADALDVLVTDWSVPESVLDQYRALGVRVYAASQGEEQ